MTQIGSKLANSVRQAKDQQSPAEATKHDAVEETKPAAAAQSAATPAKPAPKAKPKAKAEPAPEPVNKFRSRRVWPD